MTKKIYKNPYVSRVANTHEIEEMSTGFIKTQLDYIDHTEFNIEYRDKLQKEYNKRTLPKFKFI